MSRNFNQEQPKHYLINRKHITHSIFNFNNS